MTLRSRLKLALGVAGAALVAQLGLLAHMALGPENVYPDVRQSLEAFPMRFASDGDGPKVSWTGVDLPDLKLMRERMPFRPLDVFYRRYLSPETRTAVDFYLVRTDDGEERKHHPEICIRDVAGIPEDAAGRKTILLGGDRERPVQRFLFRDGRNRAFTVYYWHYAFPPEPTARQTALQRAYQTYGRSPPSVTAQVTTAVSPDGWELLETRLLASIDRRLRAEFLPPGAVGGCDRLPIGLVRE